MTKVNRIGAAPHPLHELFDWKATCKLAVLPLAKVLVQAANDLEPLGVAVPVVSDSSMNVARLVNWLLVP